MKAPTILLASIMLTLSCYPGIAQAYDMPKGNSLCTPLNKDNTALVIIYMAARNDLFPFAGKHVKQLQQLESSKRVKIFVRLDIQKPGKPSVTKHFFVEKNKILQVGPDLNLDSGDADSLVTTVKTAYERFPADEVTLIFWNHGTGAVEPTMHRSLSPSELFRSNPATGKFELKRSMGYLDALADGEIASEDTKGICFDEATGNYLTVETLTRAIGTISREVIKKKLNILACDACLMAGADVFIGLQPYVHYFVGSQEVELGTGYNYSLLLEPLIQGKFACDAYFARHFVSAYQEAYGSIMDYYTHSAIDLTHIDMLERVIDDLAQLFIDGLDRQKNKSVKEMLRLSRHKHNCTRFNEPTFLDLGHLLANILKNLSKVELATPAETQTFKEQLAMLAQHGLEIIDFVVIANSVGEKHHNATGISLYFPEFVIHKSYHQNAFAKKTHWLKFLKRYLESR